MAPVLLILFAAMIVLIISAGRMMWGHQSSNSDQPKSGWLWTWISVTVVVLTMLLTWIFLILMLKMVCIIALQFIFFISVAFLGALIYIVFIIVPIVCVERKSSKVSEYCLVITQQC